MAALDAAVPLSYCMITFPLAEKEYSAEPTQVDQEEKMMQQRRNKFKAQFLSNSQYWH